MLGGYLQEVIAMERLKKLAVVIVTIGLAILVHSRCDVAKAESAQAEVRLKRVSLFKNGLGFFVLEVTVPSDTDRFSIIPPGRACHGTFWVSHPSKMKLEAVAAEEIESQEFVDAVTITDILRANIGSSARLLCRGREKMVEGKITYVARDDKDIESRAYGAAWGGYGGRYDMPSSERSGLMMVETDSGEVCIDPANIEKAEFIEGKAKKDVRSDIKSMQLKIKMGADTSGKKLTISYLARGITWAPSYIVDISDGDRARISAKAVVINEVCDLNDVTIQLVTGVPHLKFADVVSPVAWRQSLVSFLQSLAWAQSERGRLGGVMGQIVGGYGGYGGGYGGFIGTGGAPVMPEYGVPKEGQAAEDLFLYPVKNVQLEKGESGYYPLFTESVPFKHIYLWEIPDYVDEEERYSYDRRRDQKREPEEDVWHCLRMENNTKIPWTTAPAETVKEELILGQDTLKYTPQKSKATLRITKAVSVKAEQTELEIARKREAETFYGHYFDLITVDGKLSVSNFQQKAITLEITKTLSGEVKESEPRAAIEKQARGLRRMNGIVNLTWTIELSSGERKDLSYKYEVYVRR
jgi:hypothetical protein